MARLRGLPLQLLFFTILPLTILLLIIAFGSLGLHQRAMRKLVGERDERAIRAAAAAITEQLTHRSAAVRSMALRASDTLPEHVLDDADFLSADYEGGIALFSNEGTLLASTNKTPTWEINFMEDWSENANSASSGQAFVKPITVFIEPISDPISGEKIAFAIAQTEEGITAVGAFYPATLAEQALTNLFSANDGQAAAFLTDSNGRLLFQIGDIHEPNSDLSQYAGIEPALRGESGTTYINDGGNEHVIAFSSIEPVNWALVIKEPWQAVTDPLLRFTELAPLILAPVLVLTLLGLSFGLKQIVQPLQSLEQKATALAWGDFEAIEEPVGGVHEIQRLQTELIHMAQKVKLAQQSLRGYLGAITIGQEEERRRLARDLHDDTIQSLIALNQRIQLAQLGTIGEKRGAQLAEMQQMAEQTITNLRRLTRDLRPIYLEDLGLVTALNMLARDTGQALRIPVTFRALGEEHRLSPQVELALYRMGQEGLSNVVRHAQATQAELCLDFGDDLITLLVRDDGCGFTVPESPAQMTSNGHYGLLGIQERAELIGAQMTIESKTGKGTCLTITLPVQAKEHGMK
jgi:signal transduction histidine kinase